MIRVDNKGFWVEAHITVPKFGSFPALIGPFTTMQDAAEFKDKGQHGVLHVDA